MNNFLLEQHLARFSRLEKLLRNFVVKGQNYQNLQNKRIGCVLGVDRTDEGSVFLMYDSPDYTSIEPWSSFWDEFVIVD